MTWKINTSTRLILFCMVLLSGCTELADTAVSPLKQPTSIKITKEKQVDLPYNRTFQHILLDEKNAKTIQSELRSHPSLLQNTKIKVVVFDNHVYLIGGAETQELAHQAIRITNLTADELNISKIRNQLKIGPLANTSTSDVWLETKIKALLIGSKLPVAHIQVSCYDQTIYLIGSTKPGESKQIKQYLRKQLGDKKIIMYVKENMGEN